jgi:hypothetical protein
MQNGWVLMGRILVKIGQEVNSRKYSDIVAHARSMRTPSNPSLIIIPRVGNLEIIITEIMNFYSGTAGPSRIFVDRVMWNLLTLLLHPCEVLGVVFVLVFLFTRPRDFLEPPFIVLFARFFHSRKLARILFVIVEPG